ncbi:nucleoside triphosphate pyrophosphatase [Actinospica sp.]|uniref:Maf family protein n=1 Tax=Actinospica sp. TaxID=1872142 RepID=UPI002B7BBD9B|nr:nucleoside triphosphate pyrophosphatase [Actinospica sp.]HWG25458.1 nucleoside triphosphate pyrophosphatase [Actinospica sp.]
MRLVLASQSPARLATLRAAGLEPEQIVSGVDEDGFNAASPAELALQLAIAKAQTVAANVGKDAIVIGCDSVLDFGGEALGKPADVDEARARWRAMRGKDGVLVTGHCVVDTRGGADPDDWNVVLDVNPTMVRFAEVSDEEIEGYLASGEPLQVAGAFTLDGLGGWFVESIVGDPSNVVGISLPLIRRLLGEVGVTVPELWKSHPSPAKTD